MINKIYAQQFCKDDISKIENYEQAINDNTQTWECHHRLELTLDGEFAHTPEELNRLGMYYNRPYFELIFLTKSEHSRLHHKSKAMSDETRGKMREAKKNITDETKQKMSESHKGKSHSAEHRQKISEAMKGRKRQPFTEETRQKMSEAKKGKSFTAEHRRKMSESAKARCARIQQNDIITIDNVDFKQSKTWPRYYVSKLGSYVTVTCYRS